MIRACSRADRAFEVFVPSSILRRLSVRSERDDEYNTLYLQVSLIARLLKRRCSGVQLRIPKGPLNVIIAMWP